MNLTELHQFLERIGRRPNRSLSQNFLIDQNMAQKIISTATVMPGDAILEIGSGPGILTSLLLRCGARVYAIEKDPVLAEELHRFQTADQQLTAYCADILDFPLSSLPAPMKVVANLPYHITTPIFEALLKQRELFTSFTVMIQKEVADRIMAQPGSKTFSSLALFLQFHTRIFTSFKVPASCFFPRPRVASKVLRFDLREPPLQESDRFFSIVRRAFQQRRKMIRSSLQSIYPPGLLQNALHQTGATVDARPETLTLDQWIAFYEIIETAR